MKANFLARFGLRSKTLLVLALLNAVTLLIAGVLASLSLTDMRNELGASFARSRAQLSQQMVFGLLQPELVLARRLAGSLITRQWLASPQDPVREALFFQEAEGYRSSFASRAYFVVPHSSQGFYYYDDQTDMQRQPRYRLEEGSPADAWYFATIRQAAGYNVNVNFDRSLQSARVWFNVAVRDTDGTLLGAAGSGLDLQEFLRRFTQDNPVGITAMIVDRNGLIQAHPDPAMIEYTSVSKQAGEHTLQRLLGDEQERSLLRDAMARLTSGQESLVAFSAHLGGRPHQFAMAYIAELQWLVVSAVDLQYYSLFDNPQVVVAGVVAAVLILALLVMTVAGFDRLVLLPLSQLSRSVDRVAAGAYDIRLQSARRDEIGDLTRNFDQMARNVLEYTRDLEDRVQQRTQALQEAHQRIDEAHRQLTSSIECASLFQQALLPSAQLLQHFPGELQALWRPRDLVGGDLYVYRPLDNAGLLVLMDCAGHGVPGALMTMIAHATLDVALARHDPADAAGLLACYDQTLRTLLPVRQRFGQLTSDMDMAVCHFDFATGCLTWAGARIALHAVDASGYQQYPASRRNIGGHRPPNCENLQLYPQPGTTFCLSTDGYLDQNGGEQGFCFGTAGLRAIIERCGDQPLPDCLQALDAGLLAYRGELPQRDDVTVLLFRWPDAARVPA